MRKALQIFTEHVYEVLALLLYKVLLLGILFLFSIGLFVVANTFVKVPVWLGLIVFAILAKGTLLAFFKQLYLIIAGKKLSLDDFTFDSFVLGIRAIPVMLVELLLFVVIMLPVILLWLYIPTENVFIWGLYGIYALFAAFIVGYLVIWPYLWMGVYDTNPIVALKEGLLFGIKHVEVLVPYVIWFFSCLSLFVPLINLLTYFTLYPAATINLLLSLKSVSMGKRLPL